VGGIFYDHERITDESSASFWITLARNCAKALLNSYETILKRNATKEFSTEQKYWQEIRRGRYVEFNLLHDKGTIFGLKTDGRTESILMSLPPTVRFDYQYAPEANSKEAALLEILLQPKDWV
jgi:coproporphyrinogen III oxidase